MKALQGAQKTVNARLVRLRVKVRSYRGALTTRELDCLGKRSTVRASRQGISVYTGNCQICTKVYLKEYQVDGLWNLYDVLLTNIVMVLLSNVLSYTMLLHSSPFHLVSAYSNKASICTHTLPHLFRYPSTTPFSVPNLSLFHSAIAFTFSFSSPFLSIFSAFPSTSHRP